MPDQMGMLLPHEHAANAAALQHSLMQNRLLQMQLDNEAKSSNFLQQLFAVQQPQQRPYQAPVPQAGSEMDEYYQAMGAEFGLPEGMTRDQIAGPPPAATEPQPLNFEDILRQAVATGSPQAIGQAMNIINQLTGMQAAPLNQELKRSEIAKNWAALAAPPKRSGTVAQQFIDEYLEANPGSTVAEARQAYQENEMLGKEKGKIKSMQEALGGEKEYKKALDTSAWDYIIGGKLPRSGLGGSLPLLVIKRANELQKQHGIMPESLELFRTQVKNHKKQLEVASQNETAIALTAEAVENMLPLIKEQYNQLPLESKNRLIRSIEGMYKGEVEGDPKLLAFRQLLYPWFMDYIRLTNRNPVTGGMGTTTGNEREDVRRFFTEIDSPEAFVRKLNNINADIASLKQTNSKFKHKAATQLKKMIGPDYLDVLQPPPDFDPKPFMGGGSGPIMDGEFDYIPGQGLTPRQ